MTLHIGIVASSAEGAALCYRTICESVVENEEKVGDCQLSPTVDHQRVS